MSEERKLVTVLFADVTGSTSLGEEMDPEDVRVLMSRYYAYARDIVTDHGGTLEKFIGDAVMAIFGFPRAHSDDAERALATALALRQAVANDEVLGKPFLLRIGVNTGEVVATCDHSRCDFLVTGDAVNIAARLQQYACPGEIVAGERTVHTAHAAFMFEEARLVEVKGKRIPLPVFPLRGTRIVRKADHPPFVGRKRDLLQLSLLFERTLEERRAQLVSLMAPAGAGKTRLLEEFVRELNPASQVKVITVQCPPYGHPKQTLSYQLLRDLLTDFFGTEITSSSLIELFQQDGSTHEDAFSLAEVIYRTLMFEDKDVFNPEKVFTSWRLLMKALAQQTPLVIILEDFHNASDSLLSLVEQVFHAHMAVPLLLITSSRPQLLKHRPGWGGGIQNFTTLALSSLPASLIQEIVVQQAQSLSTDQCQQITERSGGNPFFALELLRSISYATTSTPSNPLPDTICSAILACLDHLSQDGRTILQTAAVVGDSFHSAMLHAVQGRYSLQEIDTILEQLQARFLIVLAEGNLFTFQCPLIREVTYNTLSRSMRIQLHSKVASWLEAFASGQTGKLVEQIAYHHCEVIWLAQQSVVSLERHTETKSALHFLQHVWKVADPEPEASPMPVPA
jgi:class 3 adenylate cyclase